MHIYKNVARATSTSGSVHCSWGRLIWKVTQDSMLQPQLHQASWKERLLSALYQHNVDTERLHEEAKDHALCRTYLLKGLHLTYAIHVMLQHIVYICWCWCCGRSMLKSTFVSVLCRSLCALWNGMHSVVRI